MWLQRFIKLCLAYLLYDMELLMEADFFTFTIATLHNCKQLRVRRSSSIKYPLSNHFRWYCVDKQSKWRNPQRKTNTVESG